MADAGSAPSPVPTGLVAPQPDISIAGRFLGACITLYIVTLVGVLGQLYAAFHRKKQLNLADSPPAVALILATAQLGLICAAIPSGFGRHNFYLSIDDQIKGGRLVQISQFPWAWAVALGRISNAWLILRLNREWRVKINWHVKIHWRDETDRKNTFWALFIWLIIGIQLICALTMNLIQSLQCKPIEASWDPTIPGTCVDPKVFQVAVYVVRGIAILTHLCLSFIPIMFIYPLLAPLFRKIHVISVMGVGVFVIPVISVKLIYVERFMKTGDSLYDMVDLAIWSVVEALLGVFVACLPMLGKILLKEPGHVDDSTLQTGSEVALGGLSSGGDNKTEIASRSSEQGIPPSVLYHGVIKDIAVELEHR